jgi:hypothetical protein
MVHCNGPQCADTTAVAARESTAGQWFLIATRVLARSLVSVQPFNTRREFPVVYCWTLTATSANPGRKTSNRHERLELGNRLGGSFGEEPCDLAI